MGFTVRMSNSAYHIYHQDPGQAPHIGVYSFAIHQTVLDTLNHFSRETPKRVI